MNEKMHDKATFCKLKCVFNGFYRDISIRRARQYACRSPALLPLYVGCLMRALCRLSRG